MHPLRVWPFTHHPDFHWQPNTFAIWAFELVIGPSFPACANLTCKKASNKCPMGTPMKLFGCGLLSFPDCQSDYQTPPQLIWTHLILISPGGNLSPVQRSATNVSSEAPLPPPAGVWSSELLKRRYSLYLFMIFHHHMMLNVQSTMSQSPLPSSLFFRGLYLN